MLKYQRVNNGSMSNLDGQSALWLSCTANGLEQPSIQWPYISGQLIILKNSSDQKHHRLDLAVSSLELWDIGSSNLGGDSRLSWFLGSA